MTDGCLPRWAYTAIDQLCASEPDGGAPGWCTPEKARWIAEHVVRERLTRCTEIGVFGGRVLLSMGTALRYLGTGFAIGVDPYDVAHQIDGDDSVDRVTWAKDVPFERIYTDVLRRIRVLDLQAHCGILRAGSAECAGVVGELDLLHIDGNHMPGIALCDVQMWAPKVRRGGIIVLDDTTWDTVQPAREALRALCEPPVGIGDAGWEAYRKL